MSATYPEVKCGEGQRDEEMDICIHDKARVIKC